MFKIGEFSKLSQVSIKTLRYYDERGLFKPQKVDRFTSYRYYSAQQLPRLHHILTLKDLGFSLEQIREWCDQDLSSADFQALLRQKHAEIQQHITAEQVRLAHIESRLQQLEQESRMSPYEVVVKTVDAQSIMAIRSTIPDYQQVGALFGELFAYLQTQHIAPAGAPFALYHDQEYRDHDADVEVAIPITTQTPGNDRMGVRTLPATTMATVIHQGDYTTINQAYTTLMRWIEEQGYQIAGVNREVYLQGAESGVAPSQFLTEVQFPVEKAIWQSLRMVCDG